MSHWLYESDNLTIIWDYIFVPEVNEETYWNPESHTLKLIISILINGKLKTFWLDLPFKKYNFEQYGWTYTSNWVEVKWDHYWIWDYTQFIQFIDIMKWLWYMLDADQYLVDSWIKTITE